MKVPWMVTSVGLNCVTHQSYARQRSAELRADHVNLVHDSLEGRQSSSQKQSTEGQRAIVVIAHGQQVLGSIGTSDDDLVLAVVILLVLAGLINGQPPDVADLLGGSILCYIGRIDGLSVTPVDGSMGWHLEGLALNTVDALPDDGISHRLGTRHGGLV